MNAATVVIPFHQYSDFLPGAIASCLNQTYKDLKLLLLSDGAPLELVAKLRGIDDPRVEVIDDRVSVGLAARLNKSIKLVDTEFYFRMDSDDIMHPERVERQLSVFREMPEVSVVGTDAFIIDSNNVPRGQRRVRPGYIDRPSALAGTALIHPSVAFRTSWLNGRAYTPTLRRTEDMEFWVRNFEQKVFFQLGERLLYYRTSGAQGPYIIRQTAKEHRIILRRYIDDVSQLRAGLVRSHLAEWAKLVMEGIGMSGRMDRRRMQSVSGEDRANAAEYLRVALDGSDLIASHLKG